MTEAAHAIYGGSSFKRWRNCAASVRLGHLVPRKPPGAAAEKGIKAHALAEYCLLHDIRDAHEVLAMDPQPRHEYAPWDDPAMADAVNIYLDTIASAKAAYPKAKTRIEHKVYPSAEHEDKTFGTADFILYDEKSGTLKIIDYKNGTVAVDPEENDQCFFYGAGVVRDCDAHKKPVSSVEFIIVQPNVPLDGPEDAVKRWTTTPDKIRAIPAEINAAIVRNEDPDAEPTMGDWCAFCPAESICPAKRAEILDWLKTTNEDLFSGDLNMLERRPPAEMTPEEVGKLLAVIPGIEAWCTAITNLAFNMAMSNQPIPGFKLVEKTGKRKWATDDLTIGESLQLLYGLSEDDVMPRKLATITQIENRLKAVLPDASSFKEAKDYLTVEFMTKESSGLKLVPVSERGEAVSPLGATAVFADVLSSTAD